MKALPTAKDKSYNLPAYRDGLTLFLHGRTLPQETENGN